MSERLTRKEIKHDIREDEVRSFLFRVFEAGGSEAGQVVVLGASVGAVRVDGGGVSITSYEGLSFGASAGAWPSETVGELVMTSKVRAIETRMDRFDGP